MRRRKRAMNRLMSELVYIGLGSNLGQPVRQVERALHSIENIPKTRLLKQSRLYASKPQGPQDQPDFVNAVCLVETGLTPLELLDALQQIEREQGRVKKRHWGERLIDLDILLFGDREIESERLTVPHREMDSRDFVLLPLAELSPDLKVSGGETVKERVSKLDKTFVLPFERPSALL